MEAGQELDELVLERVFGVTRFSEPVIVGPSNRPRKMWWRFNDELWHDAPPLSDDIALVFLVVEKMRERGWWFTLTFEDMELPWMAQFTADAENVPRDSITPPRCIAKESSTAPHAICLAAPAALAATSSSGSE